MASCTAASESSTLKRSSSGLNTTVNGPKRLMKMHLHKTSSSNSTSSCSSSNNNNNNQRPSLVGRTWGACVGAQPAVSIPASCRCKSILACRSVPLLFILVCFLVIANTNCDVGSANEELRSEQKREQLPLQLPHLVSNLNGPAPIKLLTGLPKVSATLTASQHKHKLEPLNILREIYLDSNSKVTMLLPDEPDIVQKFHPNGRYGRRSVDNLVEPHTELGQLMLDEPLGVAWPASGVADGNQAALSTLLHGLSGRLEAEARRKSKLAEQVADESIVDLFRSNGAQVADYQLELNKLLKCNYAGVNNLYWCNPTTSKLATSGSGVHGK